MRPFSKFLLILLCFAGCRETILHDLSEHKANKVKLLLARHGIEAIKHREAGTWAVKVASRHSNGALAVLDRSRMLKRGAERRAEEKPSFVRSKLESERVMERRMAWSIEDTLNSYPGVLEARVHLRLGSPDTPLAKGRKGNASVLLVADQELGEQLPHVKQLVSGASDIPITNINVVLAVGRTLPPPEIKESPWVEELQIPLALAVCSLPLALILGKRRKKNGNAD